MVNHYPLLNNIRFDYRFYQDLTNLLINIYLNIPKENIYFCANHEFITTLISEPVNIINIDHHHDIGYRIEDWTAPLPSLECGNWIKWLKDNQLLNAYTWVRDLTSYSYQNEVPKEYWPQQELVLPFDLQNIVINYDEIDKVVICSSFNWVPPKFNELYYLWIDIYQTLTQAEIPVIIH